MRPSLHASVLGMGVLWLAAATGQDWENDAEFIITKPYENEEFWGECVAPGGSWRRQPPPSRPTTFRRVWLEGCAPAANVSLSALLSSMNVTAGHDLHLLSVPRAAQLSAATFAGLQALQRLRLTAAEGSVVVAEAGALAALSALQGLELLRVRAAALPPRLAELRLLRTGLRALPPQALLASTLELWEPELSSAEEPAGAGERVRSLVLDETPFALVQRLLRACEQLQRLELRRVRAEALPARLLAAAPQLESLTLAHSRLDTLPHDLLAYSPGIHTVNFTNIKLESLPRMLFSRVDKVLRSLTLTGNRLRARELRALQNATGLQELHLANNPLGDHCDSYRESSMLSKLNRLQLLDLSSTQVTRLCGDWLTQLQELRTLNLSGNAVGSLACEQLRIERAGKSVVDLRGNPLRRVNCSKEDFELAAADVHEGEVDLYLDSNFSCDCGAYWLLRMLRDRDVPARFDPRCAAANTSSGVIRHDQLLRRVLPEAFVCTLPHTQCARTCACELSPHAEGVRACCAGPELPVEELDVRLQTQGLRLVELRAPHAALTSISARLPLSLKYLDLSDNNITSSSTDAAAELFAGGRRVNLARNPLVCACANRPLLDVLRAHSHLVEGYEKMTCPDGRPLEPMTDNLICNMKKARYSPGALAGVVTGALLIVLLVALLGGALARPEFRLRAKALLHARGVRTRWLARRLEPRDDDCAYDAFLSHAEQDERIVAEEIVPRLEPRRRVCVSYRDWAVGAWIPTEIEASVRAARRTLCLLSPRALASRWARAELRTAHAHALSSSTPRLVLILLDVSLAELRADPELRGVLDAHVHLRWGERCFWEKLEYMLPDPLPRPPAA